MSDAAIIGVDPAKLDFRLHDAAQTVFCAWRSIDLGSERNKTGCRWVVLLGTSLSELEIIDRLRQCRQALSDVGVLHLVFDGRWNGDGDAICYLTAVFLDSDVAERNYAAVRDRLSAIVSGPVDLAVPLRHGVRFKPLHDRAVMVF